ncbi:MarR family transcriptional regulator [Caldimonas thermodepolymerans]|jgi:Transcriptional regulators|uniref:MarR family transcriptional regulator n=1 Tax=Caldimonas thermodepolymerans TaxID=215580 RepID=A0A2S5T2W2_9BURK|nr:MarR family transcriptional regulator [Caldimonas thermodepolymerans]PPE69207.1 MarR family transcriptional regulator [Caldimonas thermodepolymerans]QPC32887.1 MarR family transcriptional regulator [Caldimonas thermodepolymerans]RDI03665.1 DNA-binding MarR family transcriptional regulator [Caldimonas thermodepolymerans]TCP09634.1 DNA-binding MarR family transcriptional regulator [Caldimonas thermodepolymerans]UZG45757.1 MarR family transcriptional regulator [Caldimonas thermodepolymerans]
MQKHRSINHASAPDGGLADALVTSAFVTMAVVSRLGAEHDLSLSMVRLLGILADRRPRMTELADYLGLEKQTLSGLVARAEKKGWVARAPNPDDGRATDVFLTPEGTKLVRRLHAQGREALAPLTGALAPEDQQALERLLRRLLAARAAA